MNQARQAGRVQWPGRSGSRSRSRWHWQARQDLASQRGGSTGLVPCAFGATSHHGSNGERLRPTGVWEVLAGGRDSPSSWPRWTGRTGCLFPPQTAFPAVSRAGRRGRPRQARPGLWEIGGPDTARRGGISGKVRPTWSAASTGDQAVCPHPWPTGLRVGVQEGGRWRHRTKTVRQFPRLQ